MVDCDEFRPIRMIAYFLFIGPSFLFLAIPLTADPKKLDNPEALYIFYPFFVLHLVIGVGIIKTEVGFFLLKILSLYDEGVFPYRYCYCQ